MKLTALVLTLLLGVAVAEDKKPAEPGRSTQPAKPSDAAKSTDPSKPAEPAKPTEPAKPAEPIPATEKVYAPTDLEALKTAKGKKILVEGTIVAAGANKGETIRYLNFTKNFRDSVSLVFFAKDGGGQFTKEKLAEYVNKKVRVNGELSEFKDALQIKIESLDQVKVQPTPPPAQP